jgi:hypothetical protein
MGRRGAFRPAYSRRPLFRGRESGWGGRPGWGYLPYPYDYDDDYYGYSDYEPDMTEAPPPVRFAQSAQAAPHEIPIPHLLLERQGDRWVQITGYSRSPAPAPTEPAKIIESTHLHDVMPDRNVAAEPPRDPPPAILVFRDGHEEEVKSYTIIGNTLFTSANYWISGSWTRKIGIANLDVPATLKLNQERGSEFRLPSGPEEVVIRM